MDRSSKLCVLVAALCVMIVLAWAGLSRAQAGAETRGGAVLPPAGAPCKVFLRGDASGMAWHDRIADVGSLITREGTYVGADESWVTIRSKGKELWIPRDAIMLVEVSK
jgi:hypothetical protein